MERSEKFSRKSWDFRRETIAFDSAFKEIELLANCKFSERQTLCCFKPIGLKTRTGDLGFTQKSPVVDVFKLYAYSAKAAAVRMFLCFFGFGVLALEIGERYVQRLVTEANSDMVLIDATEDLTFEFLRAVSRLCSAESWVPLCAQLASANRSGSP